MMRLSPPVMVDSKYLIWWKGKAPIDDTWIDWSDLHALEQYERSSTSNSMGSSSLPSGENDADIQPQP